MRDNLVTLVEKFKPTLESCGLFDENQITMILMFLTDTFKSGHFLGASLAVNMISEELDIFRAEVAALEMEMGKENATCDSAMSTCNILERRIAKRVISFSNEEDIN